MKYQKIPQEEDIHLNVIKVNEPKLSWLEKVSKQLKLIIAKMYVIFKMILKVIIFIIILVIIFLLMYYLIFYKTGILLSIFYGYDIESYTKDNIDDSIDIIDPLHKYNHVYITFSTNLNYIYPTLVAMTSIILAQKNTTFLHIYHLLTPDFEDWQINILKKIPLKFEIKNKVIIRTVNMGNTFKFVQHYMKPLSKATYYRLIIQDIFPNVDKILHLDGDVIVYKDLYDLYNLDMGSNYYMGVKDFKHVSNLEQSVFKVKYQLYINAGILLINCKELRKDNLSNKFVKFIKKYDLFNKINLGDQTTINNVCINRTGEINSTFVVFNFIDLSMAYFKYYVKVFGNRFTDQEIIEFLKNPYIVHLVLCDPKPWFHGSKDKFFETKECKETKIWYKYANYTLLYNNITENFGMMLI